MGKIRDRESLEVEVGLVGRVRAAKIISSYWEVSPNPPTASQMDCDLLFKDRNLFHGIVRIGVFVNQVWAQTSSAWRGQSSSQERRCIECPSWRSPANVQSEKFFFATLEQAKAHNEKKRSTCQTSIDTHQDHLTEIEAEKAEIIAILYTANRLTQPPPSLRTVRECKCSLLGTENRLIVQDRVCSFFEKLRRRRLL